MAKKVPESEKKAMKTKKGKKPETFSTILDGLEKDFDDMVAENKTLRELVSLQKKYIRHLKGKIAKASP